MELEGKRKDARYFGLICKMGLYDFLKMVLFI